MPIRASVHAISASEDASYSNSTLRCYAGGMARDECDREDLLREATALVERIELSLHAMDSGSTAAATATENVVVGFRKNGAASFFFGADPVYQFNGAGQLRRAFCDGRLVKAVRGRLVSLTRTRRVDVVQLLSRELNDAEQSEFITRMSDRLRALATDLAARRYAIVGQVPANADVLGRVRKWVAAYDGWSIANSPRVGP